MITKRIIPCLDVRNGRVVKGVNFEGLNDVLIQKEINDILNECYEEVKKIITDNKETMTKAVDYLYDKKENSVQRYDTTMLDVVKDEKDKFFDSTNAKLQHKVIATRKTSSSTNYFNKDNFDSYDVLPITVSERLLEEIDLNENKLVKVSGQLRSYNKNIDNKNRLVLTIFVRDIKEEEEDNKDPNSIFLDGYVWGAHDTIYRIIGLNKTMIIILLFTIIVVYLSGKKRK